MRHIVLDTETTGLDPASGHRIVEIGCVELVNFIPSGRTFHHYLNPERDMPAEAERVHGITAEFLKDKPLFGAIAGDFMDFIAEDPLVIHNAGFDMKFLNHELKRMGYGTLDMARAIDTVMLARRKFPGAPASLDALCKRFNIDLSSRNLHGALLDARLLADVYLELAGGRQRGLDMTLPPRKTAAETRQANEAAPREKRSFPASADEIAAHTAAIGALKETLWEKEKPS
jgi:DNA polymerase-3 subunit epsilon